MIFLAIFILLLSEVQAQSKTLTLASNPVVMLDTLSYKLVSGKWNGDGEVLVLLKEMKSGTQKIIAMSELEEALQANSISEEDYKKIAKAVGKGLAKMVEIKFDPQPFFKDDAKKSETESKGTVDTESIISGAKSTNFQERKAELVSWSNDGDFKVKPRPIPKYESGSKYYVLTIIIGGVVYFFYTYFKKKNP